MRKQEGSSFTGDPQIDPLITIIQLYIDTVSGDHHNLDQENRKNEGYVGDDDDDDGDEDEKLLHDTAAHDKMDKKHHGGHPFAGYYLPYPDTNYEGLVSTISDDPPILNWVYVDGKTYEVKYGLRVDAQPNITGPFDCTRQDRRMTLQGWEGFVAVEEEPHVWAIYFDRDDDGLKSEVLNRSTRVLEIELWRKEKRLLKKKDPVI